MKLCRSVIPAVAAVLLCGPASAVDIYKYVLPNGSVLYSQSMLQNRKPAKVLHVPATTSAERQAQRAARREAERLQVRADRLATELAVAELAANQSQSCAAPVMGATPLISVLTPQAGERTGTVGGLSRLNEAYWDRLRVELGPTFESREQQGSLLSQASMPR